MKLKVRRCAAVISLLLFPITMNYLSPYLPVDAAMNGIIAGSLLTFALLFLSAVFTGRAWCGWVCPVAGISDICMHIQNKKANTAKLKKIRYTVFIVWVSLIILFFVLSGGIRGFDYFYFTDTGISVDSPSRYVIYYGILAAFLVVTLKAGNRGACHSFCWMSPFLVGGMKLGGALGLPRIGIRAESASCVECRACDRACPMGISVSHELKQGMVNSTDCILCGECTGACKKNVLSYGFGKGYARQPLLGRQKDNIAG
jgi:ferredoxin-type protein NapH